MTCHAKAFPYSSLGGTSGQGHDLSRAGHLLLRKGQLPHRVHEAFREKFRGTVPGFTKRNVRGPAAVEPCA